MSGDFQLESIAADTPKVINDKERVERVELLCTRVMFPKLGVWDQDFLTDIKGQTGFSPRQRTEIDRIWDQWGELA